MLGLDGGVDLVGMIVDGLSATAGGPAWRVTSPWMPARPAAALAIQVAKGILSMGWASGVWIT